MNKRQILAVGVPEACASVALAAIAEGAKSGAFAYKKPETLLAEVVAHPEAFAEHRLFGKLAAEILAERDAAIVPAVPHVPLAQFGADIDDASKDQMKQACSLPVSVAAALMPDAHVGYGLPIGGVLATENAVIPYGVGVDIACRMRLSIVDLPVHAFDGKAARLEEPLVKGTRFGVGSTWKQRQTHDVMDRDWSVTSFTAGLKDLAWQQLGTSGSGNHFAEWGLLTLLQPDLGLEAGQYVALLSHSGSRGPGAKVCDRYSTIAAKRLPRAYRDRQKLAWLGLDTAEGQEYWAAMNLMGEFAAANHAVLHRNVLERAGAQALFVVENHHNFAWKETHGGREVVVHRKGATPAGAGVLGVIPGSMADPCFVVRGKGNAASLESAAHGAGRCMSRTAARQKFSWKQWKPILERRGVRLLAGGLDEVPGVYKNIREVMAAQRELVDVVATFDPKIVMMCGDGSRAED
jgi:tRNA-splicing ligase RtcB